jgi:riboflavin synthase alpha subunit
MFLSAPFSNALNLCSSIAATRSNKLVQKKPFASYFRYKTGPNILNRMVASIPGIVYTFKIIRKCNFDITVIPKSLTEAIVSKYLLGALIL